MRGLGKKVFLVSAAAIALLGAGGRPRERETGCGGSTHEPTVSPGPSGSVTNSASYTLSRVDPSAMTAESGVSVGAQPRIIVPGHGSLWIGAVDGAAVVEVKPAV